MSSEHIMTLKDKFTIEINFRMCIQSLKDEQLMRQLGYVTIYCEINGVGCVFGLVLVEF